MNIVMTIIIQINRAFKKRKKVERSVEMKKWKKVILIG